MKSVIITGTNGQKLFCIRKLKNGNYIADVLSELDHKVTITVISDKNERIKFYPTKKSTKILTPIIILTI